MVWLMVLEDCQFRLISFVSNSVDTIMQQLTQYQLPSSRPQVSIKELIKRDCTYILIAAPKCTLSLLFIVEIVKWLVSGEFYS